MTYLFLLLFACAFIAFSWWRIRYAILCILLALPSYLIRFNIGPLPMTILEVMLLIVIAVVAIRLLRRQIPAPIFPWRWLVLFFVLTGVVAVLISPDTRQALGLYKAYILEPVLFFLVVVNVMRDRNGVRLLLWALGISVVVIGYVALLQQLHLLSIPNGYDLESPVRATSLFPFPTAVGKFVGPILAFFVALLFVQNTSGKRDARIARMFVFGVVAFGLLALVLSISRGALVGVFAAAVFASMFTARRKSILVALACIVAGAMLIPSIRGNVFSVVQGSDTSTDVHLIMWEGTWRIIQDYPVSGTGLASFPSVYNLYRDPAHVELFPNPDQFLLTIWVEMGIAGILVFLWFFWKYTTACLRLLRHERAFAVGLLSAMVALLVHGLVDTPYFKNDLAVVFWVFAACVVILNTQHADSAENI